MRCNPIRCKTTRCKPIRCNSIRCKSTKDKAKGGSAEQHEFFTLQEYALWMHDEQTKQRELAHTKGTGAKVSFRRLPTECFILNNPYQLNILLLE
jgi:hypothetical protein